MDKLTLECAYTALHNYFHWMDESTPQLVDRLKNKILQMCQIDIEVIIYSGGKSSFHGGRNELFFPYDKFVRYVTLLNSSGISFMLPLNGGLSFKEDVDLDDSEKEELELMEKNNGQYQVKNKVTITHPAIFEIINNRYPSLDIIASCIQQLDPRNNASYEQMFQRYDYVVPLNQHTTFEFLSQYSLYADKMILFLNHHCDQQDLGICYGHYLEFECKPPALLGDLSIEQLKQRFRTKIRSQLDVEDPKCDKGHLWKRKRDLVNLIGMGVDKFKIPRKTKLDDEVIHALCECISLSREESKEKVV